MHALTPDIVDNWTILKVRDGSIIHGTSVDSSDRDEKGVCIEPIELSVGFTRHFDKPFRYRDAEERNRRLGLPIHKDGLHPRSMPGDLDLEIYGLRQFMLLAMKGNPSILQILWVPTEHILKCDARGTQLIDWRHQFSTKAAGRAFAGFMKHQRERMLGERGQMRVNRPELVDEHGYDTKYAAHVIRLGLQGIELMKTGKLQLPLHPRDRDIVMAIKQGRTSYEQWESFSNELEHDLRVAITESDLPNEIVHADRMEQWMAHVYLQTWKSQQVHGRPDPNGHGMIEYIPTEVKYLDKATVDAVYYVSQKEITSESTHGN